MAYQPWTYAPRSSVRDRESRDFRENAGYRRQEERRAVAKDLPFDRYRKRQAEQPKDDNKGWFDRVAGGLEKLGKGTLDAGKDIGADVLEGLDAAGEYAVRPAFAVATGMLESERRVDPATGQATREKPGLGDVLPSLGKAVTQNPFDTYREARQAYDETVRRPGFSVFGLPETLSRALTEGVTDPLMYVPVGTAAKLGIRGSGLGAAIARNLIEGPGRIGAGVVIGGAVGAEAGERSGLPGGMVAGQLAGSFAGGAGAAAALRRFETPVLRATNETPGIRMRDDLVRMPHDQITERPDLFQGRDADPGKSYGEAKVRQIVEDYDPLKMEPGLLAQDTSTGDYVVIRGHHRLEAQKRLAADGVVSPEGTWQVVEADLSDPKVVRQLKRQALESNYTTSKTNLREDIRLARTVLTDNGSTADIRRSGRFSNQYAADLGYLATLPDDMIDEMVRRNVPHDLMAEIARVARQVELDEPGLRALANRFVYTEGKSTITRVALRETLEEHSELIQRARQQQIASRQSSMFDDDVFADSGLSDSFLADLDLIARAKTDADREIRRWNQSLRQIGQLEDPAVASARRAVEDAIGARIKELEELTEGARGRLEADASGTVRSAEGGVRPQDAGVDAGPGVRDLPGEGAQVEQPTPLDGPQTIRVEGETPQRPGAVRAGTRSFQDVPHSSAAGMRTADDGFGQGARGPEGTVGQGPEIEGAVPPGEGAPPPSPPRGQGPQQPLGSPGKPLFDALDAPDVSRARGQFEGNLTNKVDQGLRSALGRLKEEQVRRTVDPVIDAKRRIDARITHFVESRIDIERAQLRLAGLEIEQVGDEYHLLANGRDVGYAEDVIERVTPEGKAAFDALTHDQQMAIAAIGETNRLTNETLQVHGGRAPIDEGIEGEYFGRRALGRQYETATGEARMREAAPGGVSRSVGANRIKSRTQESIEAGLREGVRYDNPWDARAVRLRGKLMTAEDAWLQKSLSPLAVKKVESTLGLDTVKGHPAFNNQWFEPAVAKRIQDGLEGRGRLGPIGDYAAAVNSVMTPLRASFDLSATFQQGMRMWLTNPKAAGQYWWTVMRSLVDDKVYDGALLRLNTDGPGLDYHVSRGLRYTGDASQGEFLMPRSVLDRAGRAGPIGRAVNTTFTKSNQAFSRTLNLYRVHMANSQYQRLAAAGLEGADLDEAMRQSTRGINRMFGWTETTPTTIEQAAVFAPRYTRASVETLVKALEFGTIEGSMARTHMGLLLAEGAAAVFLLNELRGYETEWDPREANFLRLRNVGGLDVSPFGTYNTLFRAIAQTAGGGNFSTYGKNRPDPAAVWKFLEGKGSPAVKLIYEPFVKGETYLGEPQDILGDPVGVLREQATSSLPFGAQTLIKEGPRAALASSLGFSSTPLTPTERRDFARDEVAQERFGKPYAELSGADKSRVNEDERIAGHQAAADRNTLTREDDRSRSTSARLDFARKVDELSSAKARGEITGSQWRDQYQTLQAELRGARSVLDMSGGSGKDLEGWFDLYDKAELPDGRIDWALLEGLQADYAAKHPGIEEKVDKAVGAQDNATVRDYRAARDLAREYYAMPAYRGMSVEDARTASAIIQAANSMVAYGYARDRDDALRQLRRTDADGVRLAQLALRRGANPARQRWRRDPANRLFSEFYGDFTTTQVA